MKIACLAWGSLYWNPKKLLVDGNWNLDGPRLSIEFTRTSKDNRLTLVITPGAELQTTLWALMLTKDLEGAKESLKEREEMTEVSAQRYIGVLKIGDEEDSFLKSTLMAWLNLHKLDAVIWTDLPPKFNGKTNLVPTLEEALEHVERLEGLIKEQELEYIQKAPQQIDTVYRRAFHEKFKL